MPIYPKGDRVTESQYGTGTMVEANERHTAIDFDDYGVKPFSTQLVMLVRTARAPPLPNRRSRSRRGPRARTNRGAEQR
jgi:hypothetical protein